MEWGRITAPLCGTDGDKLVLTTAAEIAAGLGAVLEGSFAPLDPSDLTPWVTDGYIAGIQAAAIESLQEASKKAEGKAEACMKGLSYDKVRYGVLAAPLWRSLSQVARLSDLVVFDNEAATGDGRLADPFQQVLMEERAAVLISRGRPILGRPAIIAWDGSEPASRAARRAVPLLRHMSKIYVVGKIREDEPYELSALVDYLKDRGLDPEILPLGNTQDIAGSIEALNQQLGAGWIVSGAFGHSRVREFVFGGVTRDLLHHTTAALFMAH